MSSEDIVFSSLFMVQKDIVQALEDYRYIM